MTATESHPIENPKDLLSIREVMARLNVRSPSTVHQFIKRGVLPCVQVGDLKRVQRSVLEAFIAAGGSR